MRKESNPTQKIFEVSLKETESKPRLIHKLSTKVDDETYFRFIDLVSEADTSISHLLRKAIHFILEVGPNYFEFLYPICIECGGPLSGIFATAKLVCVKCGSVYRLTKLEGDENGDKTGEDE